jgi:NDP-sugar pyrophosphorylase family protein
MQAVIMAGGRGTRLDPYTTVLPKPLMPLSDRPIVDVILRQLVGAGVEAISISVGHLGSLIESWINQQGDYGIPISFVYEDHPLGTAGSLAKIEKLDGTFLAMNGDILTTLRYRDLVEHHRRSGAVATMAVTDRAVEVEYGLVHADEKGHVIDLEEKPHIPYTVSMGVYAFEAAITRHIGPGERVDFPDLLLRAKAAGDLVVTYPFKGYWRDIGNREDYAAAIEDFAADKERFIEAPGSS